MAKRIELNEEQMSQWAELLNLLADLTRAVIAGDAALVELSKRALVRAGWTVEIKNGGAS